MKSCLLFLYLAALLACDHARTPAPSKKLNVVAGELGSPLPEFSARDLRGREISSADLRGKVVLIDIWATWCAPCKKEMPGYQKLADRYGAKGLAVVGLKANIMADAEDPLVFAENIGVHYPLVTATGDLLHKFGGLEGLPTTLLYDRYGVLRNKVIGFEYADAFESELKPLLN